MRHVALAAAVLGALGLAASANASIIFDDFNTNEGHFGLQPTFSSQSNVATTSTADRSTLTPPGALEGAGFERLVLTMSTTNPARVRFLSGGGAPAGASGQPANTSFTTSSAAGDGFIGLYVRANTAAAGAKIAINLDGPTGATAEMDMSPLTTITADGNWHLYEWNLDATTGWGAVTSIGGGHSGKVLDGSHTIDSLYIQNLTADCTIDLDFVALNPSGSIATLVPEPASLSLLALAAPLLRRRRA